MHSESTHYISVLLSQQALFPGGKALAPVKIQKVPLRGGEAFPWSWFLQ